MFPSSSIPIWEKIERLKSDEQKHLLQWQLQAREPILSFADMRAGDHHVIRRSSMKGMISYEHHLLCIESSEEGTPKIAHYSNKSSKASKQFISTSCFSLGTSIGKAAKIEVVTLGEEYITDEAELKEEGHKMERVVWPDELLRFSVTEVKDRAESRIGENWYNLKKNNCESFVMWCLCDLNICLQITPEQ